MAVTDGNEINVAMHVLLSIVATGIKFYIESQLYTIYSLDRVTVIKCGVSFLTNL